MTASGTPPGNALRDALAKVPHDCPLVIMVHGFKFCPDRLGRDPHRHILALRPDSADRRAISWPAHLGFRRDGAGLAIAFGWESCGSIWRANRTSAGAARALATLIGMIRRERRAPVHLIAHSLGALVVLKALQSVPIGSVGKVVLMAGAAFEGDALAALNSPAGRMAEIVNISSGENFVFDAMLAGALRGFGPGSRTIGRGLRAPFPNWVDLRIDDETTRAALHRRGYRLARPVRRICHWSAYLRPGMFPLYRALFEGRLTLNELAVCQRRTPRRWRMPFRRLPI